MFDTAGEAKDTVTVNGRTQHIHGYLRDFLFPAERADSPVKALSGGERNRLLLARLFTRPANVLVLDEPTNDLDIETLELLEAYLIDWPGTLLLVSHDRAFIDHVVTSTMVFDDEGRVQEFVGGYEDWLRQAEGEPQAAEPAPAPARRASATSAVPTPPSTPSKKLSYREQQELQKLPGKIQSLEAEQQRLDTAVAAPDFYKEPAETIQRTLHRLEELRIALLDAYARWDELDSRVKS